MTEKNPDPTPGEMALLRDAKAWLLDHVTDGANCPLCGQFAKVYARKITGAMARILIAMHHESGDVNGYMHIPTIRSTMNIEAGGGGDSTKCAYWGLIEPMPEVEREDGSKRTGYWRLTERGEDFVQERIRVPEIARIYDGRVLGFAGPLVSIRDRLGVKFDYDDLMHGSVAG